MATGAGVLLLALGIGVTTSIFSIFSALFLRPLAFPESSRLLQVETVHEDGLREWVSDRDYEHWRDNSTIFESLTAYRPWDVFNVHGDLESESVRGSWVTRNYFETFGLELLFGLGFTQERPPPQPTEVVLSHGLWRRRFGADPAVLGRPLDLDGMRLTIVGVLSPRILPPFDLDVWLPLKVDASADRGTLLRVTGRLRGDVRIDNARQEMLSVHRRGLELAGRPADLEGVSLRTFQEFRYGDRRPTLLLLLSASGFVLLLTCANVANLQLSRMATRGRENAIRQALGASARQSVTTSPTGNAPPGLGRSHVWPRVLGSPHPVAHGFDPSHSQLRSATRDRRESPGVRLGRDNPGGVSERCLAYAPGTEDERRGESERTLEGVASPCEPNSCRGRQRELAIVQALLDRHFPDSAIVERDRERPDVVARIGSQLVGIEVTTVIEAQPRQTTAPQKWSAEAARIVAKAQQLFESRNADPVIVRFELRPDWSPPNRQETVELADQLVSLVEKTLARPPSLTRRSPSAVTSFAQQPTTSAQQPAGRSRLQAPSSQLLSQRTSGCGSFNWIGSALESSPFLVETLRGS